MGDVTTSLCCFCDPGTGQMVGGDFNVMCRLLIYEQVYVSGHSGRSEMTRAELLAIGKLRNLPDGDIQYTVYIHYVSSFRF